MLRPPRSEACRWNFPPPTRAARGRASSGPGRSPTAARRGRSVWRSPGCVRRPRPCRQRRPGRVPTSIGVGFRGARPAREPAGRSRPRESVRASSSSSGRAGRGLRSRPSHGDGASNRVPAHCSEHRGFRKSSRTHRTLGEAWVFGETPATSPRLAGLYANVRQRGKSAWEGVGKKCANPGDAIGIPNAARLDIHVVLALTTYPKAL